jgi:tetratricopeptide (TPR) repeat protein
MANKRKSHNPVIEKETVAIENENLPKYKSWLNKQFGNYNFWVLFIAIIGASIYLQTFSFNFTQDDSIYSTANTATLKGIKGIPEVFTHGSLKYYTAEPSNSGIYRPFTLLTFCLEHEIFKGFNPKVGHIFNIILYFLTLILIGTILNRLFSLKKIHLIIPLLILMLYALHPTHTEVVASIKSRDTLLSALFIFSSLYLYLKWNDNIGYGRKIIIGLLFFIGLLSKEEGITFIAIVFLISFIFFNKGIIKAFKDSLPFLIAGFIYLILRWIILDDSTTTYNTTLNNIVYTLEGKERLATNLYVYLYYIKLLIYPFHLSYDYSFSEITQKTFSNGWVIVSFFFFCFILFVAFKRFSNRTIISFSILYYLITFSIFSNFTESITIGSTIGERFLFLPSLGFAIILVYGIYILLQSLKGINIKYALLLICIPISYAYAYKSYIRTKVWADNSSLFQSGVQTSPKSWRVHNNLAEFYRLQGINFDLKKDSINTKVDSAKYWFRNSKYEYEKAFHVINEQPSIPYANYLNYGDVLFKLGDTLGAKGVFQRATTLSKNLSSAWYNLASIHYYEGDYKNALIYYENALKADSPDSFSIYKSIGSSYFMLQDYPNSVKAYEFALKYKKDKEIIVALSNLYNFLGSGDKNAVLDTQLPNSQNEENKLISLIAAGNSAYNNSNYNESIKYFKQAAPLYSKYGGISKYPDFLNTLGQSYVKLNQISAAKTTFKEVVQEDPRNFIALQNLAIIAYQNEKNYSLAVKYFNQCLKAKSPDYYFVYSSLGFLYWIQNMPDKAIENFEKSLQYDSSKTIINNLYQLWKLKGNQPKMEYYQALLNKE